MADACILDMSPTPNTVEGSRACTSFYMRFLLELLLLVSGIIPSAKEMQRIIYTYTHIYKYALIRVCRHIDTEDSSLLRGPFPLPY